MKCKTLDLPGRQEYAFILKIKRDETQRHADKKEEAADNVKVVPPVVNVNV